MSVNIAVVCEANADFLIASDLIDRSVLQCASWIEEEVLDAFRSFIALEENTQFISWSAANRLGREANVRVRGFFEGRPGEQDARAARRAINLILLKRPETNVIVLVRDSDGVESRRHGLQQARQESIVRDRIIIGLAECKRECWVLAGFEVRNDEERLQLEELRQQLGFNPCTESQRLTAHHSPQDLRNAKRILRLLSQGDFERERVCWMQTRFEVLRSQGAATGIVEFLDEIESILIPLFTGRNIN